MSIEFRETHIKGMVEVLQDDRHLGTLIDDEPTLNMGNIEIPINDMESILSKMKELQGEVTK